MASIPVRPDSFTVLLVFETRPDEAETFSRGLHEFVASRFPEHPGFLSGLVYCSDDQRSVVELLQWRRAEDWASYRESADGRAGLAWLRDRHPRVHYLELVGATPPSDDPVD